MNDLCSFEDTGEWTRQQETALNVFAEFMANILEKYGPIIDENKSDNEDDEGECENTCPCYFLMTKIITCIIMLVGIIYHVGGA